MCNVEGACARAEFAGSARFPLIPSPLLSGPVPAVQVFLEPLLPGGGLLTVCPSSENRIPLYLLGPSGKYEFVSYLQIE